MRIAGKVENDGAAAVQRLTPGRGALHDLQQPSHGDLILVGRLAARGLLRLRHFFQDLVALLGLLGGGQLLAILAHRALHLMAVHVEDLCVLRLGLLHAAVLVQLPGDALLQIGVILAGGVHLLLVGLHIAQERGHVRQRSRRALAGCRSRKRQKHYKRAHSHGACSLETQPSTRTEVRKFPPQENKRPAFPLRAMQAVCRCTG